MPQCQFLFIMSVYCRKAKKPKFSELDETNCVEDISPKDSQSQKGKCWGGHSPLAIAGRGLGGDRALIWRGPSVTDPELPFGLLKAPDA